MVRGRYLTFEDSIDEEILYRLILPARGILLTDASIFYLLINTIQAMDHHLDARRIHMEDDLITLHPRTVSMIHGTQKVRRK